MPTIRIDCDQNDQVAEILPAEDCPPIAWSAVRRFFEERYPAIVENRPRAVRLPCWAFLSVREAFRYVLTINGISSLDLSETARKLLVEAKARTEQYASASELTRSFSPDEVDEKLPPVGFARELFPYQSRNVAFLCGLRAGATFSVPGAGKTTEALAYFFLTRVPEDRLLVIAPKNAFVAWEDELPACAGQTLPGFVRLTGGQARIHEILSADPPAVIISYHQLPRVMNEITAYLVRNPVYMFVDESHRMKRGTEGVHGLSILSLAHLPKRKLILSGTPMPNATDDLVSQFNFLYPELSAKSDNVVEKLRSIFVRTTKGELELTPPRRVVQHIPMGPAQEKLYAALASDAARHLSGLSVTDRISFRKFAKCVQYMIQAASNPALLISSSLVGHPLLDAAIREGISSKLAYACSLVRKWVGQGHKVIIWSTFVKTVEHLAGLLADLGSHYIHGGVPTSEDPDALDSRETKIRAFNDGSSPCRVLIANPAACSEGISLHHVCHRAIYVDRNYNAAHYLQSEDRIHRIGLAPDVATYITILCSPATVDESVDRRLQAKVQVMQAVLDDPDLSIRPLNLDADDEFAGLDADDIQDLRRMLQVD